MVFATEVLIMISNLNGKLPVWVGGALMGRDAFTRIAEAELKFIIAAQIIH